MKCAQHAAHNPKFEKMGLLRHFNGGHKKIKGPTHVNVATTLENSPTPTHLFIQSGAFECVVSKHRPFLNSGLRVLTFEDENALIN